MRDEFFARYMQDILPPGLSTRKESGRRDENSIEGIINWAGGVVSDLTVAHLERLAGPSLSRMMKDQEFTETCLTHSDSNMRLAALILLWEFWKERIKLPLVCEEVLATEQDQDIRQWAVICLGDCHRNTQDERIGKLFASMVVNDENDALIRQAAYQQLYVIRGIPVYLWPDDFGEEGPATFPDGVDWSFVQSFLVKS